MGHQTFIVRLSPDTARQMRRLLERRSSGYESLNEFFEVAVLNQLNAEGETDGSRSAAPAESSPSDNVRTFDLPSRLSRPAPTSPLALMDPIPSAESLSSFTNRLSPIKIAARVLANMALSGEWPLVGHFHRDAATCARELGLRLRDRDDRSWIGYPIGDDAEKSVGRFISSFTIVGRDGSVAGPLALLGFAALEGERVGLTKDGWRLAAAPSPLVDAEGHETITLSAPEVHILRERVEASAPERSAVVELLTLIRTSKGVQTELDSLLAKAHATWTKEMVVAHRAAIIGRLLDLGLLEVSGRGVTARIRLLDGTDAFLSSDARSSSRAPRQAKG